MDFVKTLPYVPLSIFSYYIAALHSTITPSIFLLCHRTSPRRPRPRPRPLRIYSVKFHRLRRRVTTFALAPSFPPLLASRIAYLYLTPLSWPLPSRKNIAQLSSLFPFASLRPKSHITLAAISLLPFSVVGKRGLQFLIFAFLSFSNSPA